MADPIKVEQNDEFDEIPYLPARNRSFYLAFYQTRRPVTGQEINLIQQIQRDAMGRMAASFAQPGFSFKSIFTTNWQAISAAANESGNPQSVIQTTSLVMTLGRAMALVDDMPLEVGSRFGTGEITIDLGSAPQGGVRSDFVILEVWNASVGGFGTSASDQDIFSNGYVQGGTEYNDILQTTAVDTETTRRVQTRWRIRVIEDINFTANPSGFANPAVTAQGENGSPIANYTFVDMGVSATEDGPAKREYNGLWRAGSRTRQSATDLGTADGYVYALPMFIITRTASVTEPDIDDIRTLTNGNLIGVFEFLSPCTLVVKALPIHFMDCADIREQVRITAGTSPLDPIHLSNDRLFGIVAARQLQSTASTFDDTPLPPLRVSSTLLVENLNVQFLQGAEPGNGNGNVLLLDNEGNATIGGNRISIASAGTSGLNTVSLENVGGSVWLEENATYDTVNATFRQTNLSYPSSSVNLDRATGRFSVSFAPSGNNAITWTPSFAIDKQSNLSSFTTNVSIDGKVGIGNVSPSYPLDIIGNVHIQSSTVFPAMIAIAGNASDGIQVTATGFGTKAISAVNTGGDGIYAATASGSAGKFVNSASGYSIFAQGNSVFVAPDGSMGIAQVGINVLNPAAGVDLDVGGLIQTVHLRMPTGASAGLYMQTDAAGNASWAPPPTQVISDAVGNDKFLPLWQTGNGLINSIAYQHYSDTISIGIPAVTTITPPPHATLITNGGIIVNYANTHPVPDTVSGSLDALARSGIAWGMSDDGTNPSTSAIFSNRGSLPDSTYSNLNGLSFMVNNNVRVVITPTGNIGIGLTDVNNTATNAKLMVGGSIGIGAAVTGNARVDYPYLTIVANPADGPANRRTGVQFKKGNIPTFSMGVDTQYNATDSLDGNPNDLNNFFIKQHVTGADVPVPTRPDGLTRFMIDSNGFVGIGTGNAPPATQLHVIGDIQDEGHLTVMGRSNTDAPGITLYRRFIGTTHNSYINFDSADPANENTTRATNFQIGSDGTGLQILDNNLARTRMYMNSSTNKTTFGAAKSSVGIGQVSIASPTGVVMAGTATGQIFNAIADRLSQTNGTKVPVASFGSIITDTGSVDRNVALTIIAERTAQGNTLATSALSFGLSVDNSMNYVNSSLWFFPTGGIAVGGNSIAAGVMLDVWGNQNNRGNITATGNLNSYSNNIAFGSGYSPTINTLTAAYPALSISTNSTSNLRTGIIFYKNVTPQWSLGVDLNSANQKNFYIRDEVANAPRVFIDTSGNVGIGVSGSTDLRGRLDVVGGAIAADAIAINDVITDATTGGPWKFVSKGAALFIGQTPNVQMKIGASSGAYGVQIITPAAIGGGNNDAPALYVHADQTGSVLSAAAVISSATGTALSLDVPIGNYALVAQHGNVSINSGTLTVSGLIQGLAAFNLAGNANITGGVAITGFGASNSVTATTSILTNTTIQAVSHAIIGGNLSVGGTTAFSGNVIISANSVGPSHLYALGDVNVRGTVNTSYLVSNGAAVMYQSIQRKPQGGRLLAMLGEYAGHNIKDYLFIHPSDPHNIILSPKRFTGLTIGIDWYEILGNIVPDGNLAGMPDGAYELVAYAAAPVDFGWIATQQIGLLWKQMGYTASKPSNDFEGENNHRVLAYYYHTSTGIVPLSKDTTELDYQDSTSVGLRAVNFFNTANQNGTPWVAGGTVDAWVDTIAGANFPVYVWYSAKPQFIQFNWNTAFSFSSAGSTHYFEWALHLTSNGQAWGPLGQGTPGVDQTEIVPLAHQWSVGTGSAPTTSHSTYCVWVPAGVHQIRQRIHLSGAYGTADLSESWLQMILWSAGEGPAVDIFSPPAVPTPPAQPSAPVVVVPTVPLSFTAAGVWSRSEEAHWQPPASLGNANSVTYNVEWRDYGSLGGSTILSSGTISTGGLAVQRDVGEDNHSTYRVQAVNSAGGGPFTAWVDANTWHTNVPDPPRNFPDP